MTTTSPEIPSLPLNSTTIDHLASAASATKTSSMTPSTSRLTSFTSHTPVSLSSKFTATKNNYGDVKRQILDDCLLRLLKRTTADNVEDCKEVFDRFKRKFEVRDWEDNLSRGFARVMLPLNEEKNFSIDEFPDLKLRLYKFNSKSEFLQILAQQNNGKLEEDFWVTFDHNTENRISFSSTELETVSYPFTVVAANIQRVLWSNNNLTSVNPVKPVESSNSEDNYKLELNKVFRILPPSSSILSLSVLYQDSDNKNIVKKSISVKPVISLKHDSSWLELERRTNRKVPLNGVSYECAFLKMNQNLSWSTEGCHFVSKNNGLVTCACNHTTSFGVMLAVRTIKVPTVVSIVMTALESVSLIALALTIVLLLWLKKKIRNDRTVVQINLAFSLMFFHFFFLVGGSAVNLNSRFCEVCSVLTHFFTLASAFWMLNEGIVLYLKTCKQALSLDTKKMIPFITFFAWGFPFVLVFVCAAIGFSNGTYMDKRPTILNATENDNIPMYNVCWVGVESNMIYAVVTPLAFVFCLTTLIVLKTSIQIAQMSKNKKTMTPRGKRESKDVSEGQIVLPMQNRPRRRRTTLPGNFRLCPKQASVALRAVLLLLPVLGIPWALGFLVNIEYAEEIFLILHGVINGLQGVFIFYLYCIKNSQFRRAFDQKLSQISSHNKDINTANTSKFSRGLSQSGSHAKRRS